MLPRATEVAGLAFGLALLILIQHAAEVEAVTWITADSQGRKTAFEIAADHPALQVRVQVEQVGIFII
jgi:hypothetical protein